jgi:hypothetical protein
MNSIAQQENAGQERPRAKFVSAVWGKTYIERFATLALPSFLAPGNLPALAAATDLEIVILTRGSDVKHFEELHALHRLRAICPVRFVAIDDLITTGVYGVTLTLAYARAVIQCGEDMLKTHFVFMNADFVLADGSLRSLCRHILAGRSIVLGPSFRATAEDVEPGLRAAAASGVLAIPPRRLVAMSLAHAHPTTEAKNRNQNLLHSTHPNQFFWWVDKHTLLGRYYLIFMLCLRPERVIQSIGGYCDYALIPDLCPSGDEVAMGDSDEFFMLELQSHNQESGMLRTGRQRIRDTVRSLAEWTTAEHRRAASHDIVFHAGDIPAGIGAARAQAGAFIDNLNRRLGPPIAHDRHPYWIKGVAAWQRLRKSDRLSSTAPELRTIKQGFFSALLSFLSLSELRRRGWAAVFKAKAVIYGQWPQVSMLHPSWSDMRHLQGVIAEIFGSDSADVLVVRSNPARIDPLIESRANVYCIDTKALLDGEPPAGTEQLARALIYLDRTEFQYARLVVERCREIILEGGTCHLFVHDLVVESQALSSQLIHHVEEVLGKPGSTATCTFVGGIAKRTAQSMLEMMQRIGGRHGLKSLPVLLLLISFVVPVSALVNLRRRATGPTQQFTPYCSSVAIRFESAPDIE